MLISYNAAFQFNPILGLVVALLLALVMPWLLMRSLRFKLYNTSYRGLRFGFAGDNRGAYRAFLMYPLLAAMTLYLLNSDCQQLQQEERSETAFITKDCM